MLVLRRTGVGMLAAVLLGAASLAACGSKDSSNSDASSASLNSMSADQLYEQAKKEAGSITWYSSLTAAIMTTLGTQFQTAYPGVEIDPVYLSGQTSLTRIEAEQRARKPVADLVSGSNFPVLAQQAGYIDSTFTPTDAPKLPDGVKMPAGLAVDRILTNVIVYNPGAVTKAGLQPPTSYEDFTKPEWHGRFSIKATTADTLLALGPTQGYDPVLDFAKRLGENKPLFAASVAVASAQVEAGTTLATVNGYGFDAAALKKKNPAAIEFVNPNPLPVSISEIGVVKGGQHPAGARLFLNWLVSKQGQQIIADHGLTSLRDDVTNTPGTWDPAKWKPAYQDPSISSERNLELLKQWQEALDYTAK